jgi:hypothetical protein
MNHAAVDVQFDRVHMFLDMSDGPAVQLPFDPSPMALPFRAIDHSAHRLKRPKLSTSYAYCLCHWSVSLFRRIPTAAPCMRPLMSARVTSKLCRAEPSRAEPSRAEKGVRAGRQACAVKLAGVRANNENRRGANERRSALHQQLRYAS